MGVLPNQTIDFSVPNPKATAQFSMPLYQGAGFRSDFKTWSLLNNGGFMKFDLQIPQAIPVDLTLTLCASLVQGQANCPITITVNGQTFVRSYSDHDANFHKKTFVIPQELLHPGSNEVIVRLDYTATTQLFIQAATVDQAVLRQQTIDFSVPNPAATAQLSLPLYQGAGYRSDFKTWSLLVNGGFFKLNLSIADAIPVTLTLGLCAALVGGKANCPISITANGQPVVTGYRDGDCNFHSKAFDIASKLLHSGNNEIRISLDMDASTQMFINAATVSGE
jgi:hypothetical protein